MPVQLKESKKSSKSAPTAGPSADDRGVVTHGGKRIEGRLGSIIGDDVNAPRIMIIAEGVEVGMTGYIRDGVDGVLASFTIDEVKGARAFAVVQIARTQLRANAYCVINAAPPLSKTRSKPRVIGHRVAGEYIEIVIDKGSDQGVYLGMKGVLVGPKGLSFTITKVDARTAISQIRGTTIDEVRSHQEVQLELPSAAPVQRRASGAGVAAQDVQSTAQAGVAGASSPLPFLDVIQRSFGKHDVSGVRAQVGGPATDASQALGARAYATGNTVAFASAPDLHTAAHEAAHTVQQARGAVGFQGLGAADDEHERHADAVADAVVAGQSAESLLELPRSGSATTAVQRKSKRPQLDDEAVEARAILMDPLISAA
jgi:Domain of unknown function (DUF4157)